MNSLAALAISFALALTPPLAISYALWRLAGRPTPSRAKHLASAFLVGALTSVAVYGHAGPVPVALLFVLRANGQYLPWLAWVMSTGTLCVLFTIALARRVAAQSVACPDPTLHK